MKCPQACTVLRLLTVLVLIMSCALLAACNDTENEAKPTDAPTDAPEASAAEIPTVTEPTVPTEAPTEVPTEAPTEAPTEPPTEVPTEPPFVLDPSDIDFSDLPEADLLAALTKVRYCEASVTQDADEGQVIRLTARDIKSVGTSPIVYFRYDTLCKGHGAVPVSTADKPFVLLKVKPERVHSRVLQFMGCMSSAETESRRTPMVSRIPDGDGWSIIGFDFTNIAEADKLDVFRICFELLAGEDGESLLWAGIRFCSADEAAQYITPDTYPLTDRTADANDLRLLQFNIQTESGNRAPFPVRGSMYRDLLDTLQPDVVGMQECTPTWRKWLDTFVFNDSYTGIGEERTPGGESNPIYWRTDKYDLVEGGTFWLSDTPDVPGSSVAGANYPRICTWVVLRDKVTATEFVHLNCHLDHNGNNTSSDGNNIRKAQMAVIIRFAQRFGDKPLFLSGDLNTMRMTSKGDVYALYKYIIGESTVKDADGNKISLQLGDSRFDAPVTVDENHTATMTKYYDETSTAYNPARQPIDYVFYNPRNTVALSYETFLISQDGVWISDHLPVFTTFRMQATAEQQ